MKNPDYRRCQDAAARVWMNRGGEASLPPTPPEFDLPPVHDGQEGFAKANLGGEVKLVNVFASWCVPCKFEHPVLMRCAETNDTPLYGINYKDKKTDAVAWPADSGCRHTPSDFCLTAPTEHECGEIHGRDCPCFCARLR